MQVKFVFFDDLQAGNDASSVPHLLRFIHLVWNCGHPSLQVGALPRFNVLLCPSLWQTFKKQTEDKPKKRILKQLHLLPCVCVLPLLFIVTQVKINR